MAQHENNTSNETKFTPTNPTIKHTRTKTSQQQTTKTSNGKKNTPRQDTTKEKHEHANTHTPKAQHNKEQTQ